MAKSGARIGLTLKLINGSSYEFWRPELECLEIDSDAPDEVVKEQIKRAVQVSFWAYEALTEQMTEIINKQKVQIQQEIK